MSIEELLATFRARPDCQVLPPSGIPVVETGHQLPADLSEFYTLCGGMRLWEADVFPLRIVSSDRCVLANPVIIVGVSAAILAETRGHCSWTWYVVGEGPNGQYVTIDFAPERLGLCYNSSWEVHPGNSTIIAYSFTDFLNRLADSNGQTWYWDDAEFVSLGDACGDL
jgi:antitoxin YokJ